MVFTLSLKEIEILTLFPRVSRKGQFDLGPITGRVEVTLIDLFCFTVALHNHRSTKPKKAQT